MMQPGSPRSSTQAGRVGQQYHRDTGNWGIAFVQQFHHDRSSRLTHHDVIQLRISGGQLGESKGDVVELVELLFLAILSTPREA